MCGLSFKTWPLLSCSPFLSILLLAVTGTRAVCDTNPLDPTSSTSGNSYHQWISSLPNEKYTNNLFIPSASNSCEGLAFHWKIDKEGSKVSIAVAAKADGWVALGFSETGGMKGADIVYFESVTSLLVDAHVGDAYMRPTRDGIQDWKLNQSNVTDDGFIIFEADRSLFTNEGHEDHEIVDDSNIFVSDHIIIGAWGDDASLSFHGSNVVKSSVQLFSSDKLEAGNGLSIFRQEMEERADGFAVLQLDNYLIPQAETTYYTLCFTVDELIDLGLYKDEFTSTHIIGMEFLVNPDTLKYAHHILLQGHVGDSDNCSFWNMRILAGWTPGNHFVHFPTGMGLQIGGDGSGDFNAISLEYHFDNVDGDASKIDNRSGIKIYYSNTPVDNEIGMVVMGDGILGLQGEKIGNGKSKHEFTCPSTCTGTFGIDEVTVITEAHHMHAAGKRMVTQVIRGDQIVNTAAVDYWDFDQNGIGTVRQSPYKLKKGDEFHTTCYYESYKKTEFGLASSEEMCMSFIYYYPKQPNFIHCAPRFFQASCVGSHSSSVLESDSSFDREMTQTPAPQTTIMPTNAPTPFPTMTQTATPTNTPTLLPTMLPTNAPTPIPTVTPTTTPTNAPTPIPTVTPTTTPTNAPTLLPTMLPTNAPTPSPTMLPTNAPTPLPTVTPTAMPTNSPSPLPTVTPTAMPTNATSPLPTVTPTMAPRHASTPFPTVAPTGPTFTDSPTPVSTRMPTKVPMNSSAPTITFSEIPTKDLANETLPVSPTVPTAPPDSNENISRANRIVIMLSSYTLTMLALLAHFM